MQASATAAQATRIAPFLGTHCAYYARLGYLSPDGNWVLCDPTVMNRNGKTWTFSLSEYFNVQTFDYDLRAISWTPDGKYLFFAARQPVNRADVVPYQLYWALLRWNLETGKVNTVLPLNQKTFSAYLLSISPGGKRLAYASSSQSGSMPSRVVLRDLKSGAENFYEFGSSYAIAGEFAWSADGTELDVPLASGPGLYLAKVNVLVGSSPVITESTPGPTPASTP